MSILERPDAEPVPPEIEQEILAPFIEATNVTLAELARMEPYVRSTYRVQGPRTLGDISAKLDLGTSAAWSLLVSLSNATATALAARILADATPEPDEDLIRDCMGEVANVISGQAKTILSESPYQLTLSTPTILLGAGLEIGGPGTEGLVIIFVCEAGEFAIQLCRQR